MSVCVRANESEFVMAEVTPFFERLWPGMTMEKPMQPDWKKR